LDDILPSRDWISGGPRARGVFLVSDHERGGGRLETGLASSTPPSGLAGIGTPLSSIPLLP
jgi:hypothetical protein